MIRRLLGRTLLCVSLIVLGTAWAARATVAPPTTPVTGNATYFDGLGQPYGGCGVPQANLDSQDFVALNVFNTPGDYSTYTRPVPASLADKMGVWNNGLNCGRWVQVTIGDYCTGINDGAQNQPFCRNGSWVSDAYNGATLTMLVADSCADPNAWCRDDPYHLDLHKDSINRFQLNGSPTSDLLNHWNNRHISWKFVSPPSYSGDLQIGFLQGAQSWWGAIAISHLPNGIHGVEYYSGGSWQSASMDGDMGQAYIVSPTTAGGTQFQIRVKDASDAYVNGGRVYNFSLPASCGSQCSAPYTQVSYTTGTSTTSPSPSPTTTSPSPSPSPTTTSPSPSPSPTGQGCTVTQTIVNAWNGGYQLLFTITNNTSVATSGWRMSFSFPGGQTLASSWSATVSQSGSTYVASNTSWNAGIPPGGSTSWGVIVNGTPAQAIVIGCTVPQV